MKLRIAIVVTCAVAINAWGSERVLKQEPARGELRQGEVVLVDDGTCPKGEIKQVTGGGNVRGDFGSNRQRRCIPGPEASPKLPQ